jgi:hypothetical protein
VEKMYGKTPDISMFWYVFWQAVLFFEAKARYPIQNFLPGHFINIAWNHVGAFTFCVWSEPFGDWLKGQELIRNILNLDVQFQKAGKWKKKRKFNPRKTFKFDVQVLRNVRDAIEIDKMLNSSH